MIDSNTTPERRTRAYLNVDSTAVMAVTSIFLIALIAVSFIQSFTALVAVAKWTGLPAHLGWIVPSVVDSAILIFTLSALVMHSRGQTRGTAYAWSMLLLFTALSIAANVMHAVDSTAGADVRRIVTGAVLAGAAPFVVFTASHMLSLVVIEPSNLRQQTTRLTPEVPASAMAFVAAGASTLPSVEQPHAKAIEAAQNNDELDLVEYLKTVAADGEKITGNLIAEYLGVSARTGRRRLDALKASHPHLLESSPLEASIA